MKRSRMGQPEWASEAEGKLADEWMHSGSDLSITDYILAHASDRLKAEYQRQEEAYKGMRFGREVLPDGEIVIYN